MSGRSGTTATSWRARLRRVWPVAKYVIGLGLAALAFDQLTGHKSELSEASVALRHLHWGWVLLAVAAEAGSFLAFAQLQRRLLRAGRTDVGLGPMTAITVAANSITNSLPAGSVLAPVYSFRQFRRRGADQAVAGWSLAATFVAGSVTLPVLAAVGAIVAGAEGRAWTWSASSRSSCCWRWPWARSSCRNARWPGRSARPFTCGSG